MLKILKNLVDQGVIKDIDFHFAEVIASKIENKDSKDIVDGVAFVSALLSNELQKGNVCIDGSAKGVKKPFGLNTEQFEALFEHSLGYYFEHAAQSLATSSNADKPVVYSSGLFYLNRFWKFEQSVADAFSKKNASTVVDEEFSFSGTKKLLDNLFPRPYEFLLAKFADNPTYNTVVDILDVTDVHGLDEVSILKVVNEAETVEDLKELDSLIPESKCLNWQKVAVAVALLKKFSVISGGPGTGKTTTVCKLLAALISEKMVDGEELDIKLVAPTGKAAARLTESIGNTIATLPVSDKVKELIPTKASTVHRLLGAVHGRSDYRFNKNNPLHLDVLVVDEASMVDLPMMAKLIAALPPHAKLILLGDKDQLASVDAGAVLGDICGFSNSGYSHDFANLLSELTGFSLEGSDKAVGVSDCLCVLQKSYRFHKDSGIGKLAKSINDGSSNAVMKWFGEGFKDIDYSELTSSVYDKMIATVAKTYHHYLDLIKTQSEPRDVIRAFNSSRLLCALREGDFGVTGLNSRIEKRLETDGAMGISNHGIWYEGRPVMISRNDYGMGLYNGDIGITMRSKEDDSLKVYFEMPDGEIKGFLTCRIPDHETAYAMTIHKSQGSEFNKTFMVLPVDYTPLITRELVYTGVTRAKQYLSLYATEQTLDLGVKIKTERISGLSKSLGGLDE